MVHTCGLCNIQNIVRGEIFDDEGEENYFHGICYQGSMVLDGALNGYAFFKCLLGSLAPILVANGYEQGYTSHRFHPQNWIFALDVLRGDEVIGHWLCAQSELSDCARYIDQHTEHELKKDIKKWFKLELPGRNRGDTSQIVAGLRCPDQTHSTYVILALQGTFPKQLYLTLIIQFFMTLKSVQMIRQVYIIHYNPSSTITQKLNLFHRPRNVYGTARTLTNFVES
jgi:hypothetical protein